MNDQKNKVKPLTKQDRYDAFMRAVHSTSGAKTRWEQRRKSGLNDADLTDALRYELGIFGGCCGGDMLNIAYQGSGLKIWAGWENVNHCTDEPILQGNQTIAFARQVFGIKDPDEVQLSLF